jgi:hypothetical protein
MIVRSQWGPANAGLTITDFSELVNFYTTSEVAPNNAYYAGRQAFLGGARELRLYRIAGSGAVKATVTLSDTAGTPVQAIRFDAKNIGTYGNGFSVQSRVNPGDATKTDLLLTVGGILMATWTSSIPRGTVGHIKNLVDLVNADSGNFWVTAVLLNEGNSIPGTAVLTLAGGSNGSAPTMTDYANLLNTVGLETDDWDVFTCDIKNADLAGIDATIASWIKDLRNDGNRVALVTGSDLAETSTAAQAAAAAINQEGVQYVFPGVQQVDGNGNLVTKRGAAFAAQVAGIRSSLPLGQGMTFTTLQEVINLESQSKGSTIDLLIKNGVTVVGKAGQLFNIVKGVTTLVTPGSALDGNPIPQGFKKVSIVNTCDAIAGAIELAARTNYIGKVPNDPAGRAAIVGVVRDFLRVMAGMRAIQNNYSVGISESRVSEGERLYLDMAITVIDTIDVILVTVKVGT